MIIGITNIGNGELAVIGCGVLVLYLLGHLGKRVIDRWIGSMRRQSTMDEHAAAALTLAGKNPVPYAGFNEPFPAESAPDLDEDQVSAETYGNHAAVPPATPAETTRYLPRLDRLPVDDPAALRIVESLTSGGER